MQVETMSATITNPGSALWYEAAAQSPPAGFGRAPAGRWCLLPFALISLEAREFAEIFLQFRFLDRRAYPSASGSHGIWQLSGLGIFFHADQFARTFPIFGVVSVGAAVRFPKTARAHPDAT